MIERTSGPSESREIMSYKLKLLNNTQARVILKMIPNYGEDFPHYNLSYLSKVVGINQGYLSEVLDFLCDKDVVSFDGESFFINEDNLYKIEDVLNIQPMVILKKRIDEYSEEG